MRVNSIGANYSVGNIRKNPSFGKMYVTLSKQNNADYVEKEVIKNFEKDYYPEISKNETIKKFQGVYGDEINCFVLAAGAGTRFKGLAQTQGPQVNKVSYRFNLENGKGFHMPDTNLARASHYMTEEGINIVTAEKANGSLGQVIETYMRDKEPVKDTIIYCGDNQLHTENAMDIDKFFAKALLKDNKMALISASKTPKQVADSLGVMLLDNSGRTDDLYNLTAFEEKPKLDRALELADETGNCYANAGMFAISKDAMLWLIEEIEKDPNFIAKDETEVYDFAKAQEKILAKFGPSKCVVKVVDGDNWIDTGKPSDYQNFLEQVRDEGKFINVFAKQDQKDIQETMQTKVGKGYFINQDENDDLDVDIIDNLPFKMMGLDQDCMVIH